MNISILDYIPTGQANAITRHKLHQLTGLRDRTIRKEIEKARASGNIIINLQDGKGYYQPETLDEIEIQFKLNQSRAMSVLVQQKYLRRELKKAGRM
jgi:hypothetical protein